MGFAYRVALTAGCFVFAPVLDLDPVHGAELLHSRQPHHVLLHDFHVAVNVETRAEKQSLALYDKALRRTRDICRGVCSKVPTTSLSGFFPPPPLSLALAKSYKILKTLFSKD